MVRGLDDKEFDLMRVVQEPIAVHEGASILDTLDMFKRAPIDMALVVDEYGGLQGIVTQTDLLEAITGDLPDTEPRAGTEKARGRLIPRRWRDVDLRRAAALRSWYAPGRRLRHAAGFVVLLFDRIPVVGEGVEWRGWSFEVSAMDRYRIDKVLVKRMGEDEQSVAASQAV